MTTERRIEDLRTGSEAEGDVLSLDSDLNPVWSAPAQAAHLTPGTATAAQITQALINAGLMASS